MKVMLIYPPFCMPTVLPYSITYLKSFLSANSDLEIKCLDLNAKFHKRKFSDLYKRLSKAKNNLNSYSELLEEYSSRSKKVYRENNLAVTKGKEPEMFKEILDMILGYKPDVVGFSLVYNSQIFYTLKLIDELSKHGIVCVAGGPAAGKLIERKAAILKDEIELLKFLTKKEVYKQHYALDFSDYEYEDYLSKEMIFPMRSSYGCCYKACTFCTHHRNVSYKEISMLDIKQSIKNNKIKNIFLIDDLIPAKRLSELADAIKTLDVRWWCQTRPTKDLLGLFSKLKQSGLVSISFGVESGNQRILDSMRKGTNVGDIRKVLSESHNAGIRNIIFIIFGFPGENKTSFMDTINFLKENKETLDIVSASVFGLQKGSYVYEHPENFGVCNISEKETPLGESISYNVIKGWGAENTKVMKETLMKEVKKINKLPRIFCLLKEQSLFF